MQILKLVDLNIEGNKHIPLVTEFLKAEKPDIVCLQEVLSSDVEYFKNLLGMDGCFAPTAQILKENALKLEPGNTWGVMVLTNQPQPTYDITYYAGSPESLPEFKDNYHNSDCRVFVAMKFDSGDKSYTISSTHFTWSEGGYLTDMQKEHWQKLSAILDAYPSLVLSGDFNAPRGREIWGILAKRYTDNIPSDIKTTIDQNLHRRQGLQHVVDGLFSTPDYFIENVEVKSGISDHMGIVASIS